MSDTPRTDKVAFKFQPDPLGSDLVFANFCRELERELNEAKAENAALREDKERLDCGKILTIEWDELGNDLPCIHHTDLRAAIDAARKEAKP